MKVALVYDRVNKWGGAERVLLALHTIFPDAPLYTAVYDKQKASWASVFQIHTSFLQQIPFAKSHHELFAALMPLAFEQFDFSGFDVVISVTSEAAKGIIVRPPTKHICICLTPTRYLWSGHNDYFTNIFLKIFSRPLLAYLQRWDYIAAQRPDAFIAISQEVQKRIKTYYHRDSTVIYPPLTEFRIQNSELRIKQKDYFLVVSRLSRFTPFKRVELAIKAANELHLPLKIVGEGNYSYLKKIAGPTIEFVGKVNDEELVMYYKQCKALIFPGVEDFGLVMAEANSFGKPVIAYQAGGAKEIIKAGKTGVFFTPQTVSELVSVLKKFNEHDYNSNVCRENAERFSFDHFQNELNSFINQTK